MRDGITILVELNNFTHFRHLQKKTEAAKLNRGLTVETL